MPLWASVGAIGAFFSVATRIRNRDNPAISIELGAQDIVLDASTRIIVGAISAIILCQLIKLNIVSLKIGDAAKMNGWHGEIIFAFVAGFSERLVSDYLGTIDKISDGERPSVTQARNAAGGTTTQDKPSPNTGAPDDKSPPNDPAPAPQDQAGDNPARPPILPPGPEGILPPLAATDSDDDDSQDGCLCDHDIPDDMITRDEELPLASGRITEDKEA